MAQLEEVAIREIGVIIPIRLGEDEVSLTLEDIVRAVNGSIEDIVVELRAIHYGRSRKLSSWMGM